MKFSKTACVLLIFLIAGLIAESCFDCHPSYFTCSIASLKLVSVDDREEYLEIAGHRPVSRSHYGIRIYFDMEKYIAECRRSRSFIQSANAMEQCKDYYSLKDSIASIRIFSDRNFDASHPSGADISDCFMIREHVVTSTVPLVESLVLIPLTDYLKNFVPNDYGDIGTITCMLATPPDTGEYTFTVIAHLSDGRELEQSIKTVLE